MDNPEPNVRKRQILQESALPAAPMAMPEQTLIRPRNRVFLLRPFFQWLALR